MGELNDTALLERKSGKGNTPKKDRHKGGRGNQKGLDFFGVVDILAEMQWRLENPSADPTTPPQKAVLNFYKSDFPSFVAQYTELRAAKANEELAKAQRDNPTRVVTASGEEPLEISETDLKIDEAIDRVIQQLEEFDNAEDRPGSIGGAGTP
jgi:hypothetical protein